MWRLFFAFLAAAALLYGGLHFLGRHDRLSARSALPQPTPTTVVAD
jgi:hypothetical protein